MSLNGVIPFLQAVACPPEGTRFQSEAVRVPDLGPRRRKLEHVVKPMLAAEWLGLEEPQPTAEPSEVQENYDPDAWLYRFRAISMLKRYMQLSMEAGRLPSLLGREFFRSHVTSYRATTFEDVVIFVIDMERSLDKLDEFSRMVLARLVLQEYTHDELAAQLGCTRWSSRRHLQDALDKLIAILLSVGLLLPEDSPKDEGEAEAAGATEADFEAELGGVP